MTRFSTPQLSTHLTARQFIDAYNSVAYANQKQLVMNAHISVTWSTVGVTGDQEVAAATDRLLTAIDAACEDSGRPSAWICVIERGRVRGLHAHILLHSDKSRSAELKRWLEFQVYKIAGLYPLVGTNGETVFVDCKYDRHISVQWMLFKYLMKGIDPQAMLPTHNERSIVEFAGLEAEDEGTVTGPRLLIARSIDVHARQASRFKSLLDEGCTDYGKLFSEVYYWDKPVSGLVRRAWGWGTEIEPRPHAVAITPTY